MGARQQEGTIHFHYVNDVHWPVALLGQIGLLAVFVMMVRQRRWNSAIFLGFVMAALLGNALICGALSNPHDRYQSRLVWLPVFALALLGTEGRFSLRDHTESVT
jgi:lipoprotein signal peptidase